MNHFSKVENEKEWQDLLDKTLFKTFFHSLEWEKFLEQEFQWLKFERYLYQKKGLLSLAKVKIFGKEKLISHPFCEYGGFLPLEAELDFQQFKEDLFKEFKNPLKIRFHPHLLNYFKNTFQRALGVFGDLERITYFIEDFNQKNKENLWYFLRKTTRQQIKKAQDLPLMIKKCESQKELRDFYNLYLKSAKKHQIPAYPFSFFKKYNANLQMNGNDANTEIVLALSKNRVVAGSVFLFYGGFIHYFLNASDSKLVRGVNHLILWKEIEKYAGKNFQVFDFGGTRINSPLQVFKEGFGAKAFPILEIKNFKEEKLKLNFLRKAWGLLPIFLIKIFSPHFLKYKL